MKTRSVLSASIVGIVILSVLGVSLNSSEESHDNKIRIAYFPNIGHAIPIVGMEKGFFETSMGNTTKIDAWFYGRFESDLRFK